MDINTWRPRQPVWRDLGYVIPDGSSITTEEALRRVDGQSQVDTTPLYYRTSSGEFRSIPRFAIIRYAGNSSQEDAFLGVATQRYRLLDTKELTDSVDTLAKNFPLDTVASLDEGALLFFSLKGPQHEILGYPVTIYYLIVDVRKESSGGKAFGSFRIVQIPVWEPLQACLNGDVGNSMLSTPLLHDKTLSNQVTYRLAVLPTLRDRSVDLLCELQELANKRLGPGDVSRILEQVYPTLPADDSSLDQLTKRKWQQQAHNRLVFQSEAKLRWQEVCSQHPELADTALGLYLAICDYEDYRKGQKINAQKSALFGDRAGTKVAAFKACSQNSTVK